MFPPISVTDETISGGITASHNLFGIRINRNARYFAAVLAQEVVEWQFMRLASLAVFALLAAPCIVLLPTAWLPVMLPAVLIACLGLVPAFEPLRRRMELVGQAREIAVAHVFYRADLDLLTTREARVLAYHYDMFEHWTQAETEAALRQRVPGQITWAKANIGKITRWDALAS